MFGGAAAFLFASAVVGSIIQVADKLRRVHPLLETSFYVLICIALLILLIGPLFSVLIRPTTFGLEVSPEGLNRYDGRRLRKLARFLMKYGRLNEDERGRVSVALLRGNDLREPLQLIFERKCSVARDLVMDRAKLTFCCISVSQSGLLDGILLILLSVRVIKEVVQCFGLRPSFVQLVKLYACMLVAAVIADSFEDFDLDNVLPEALTKVPGASFLLSSATQGIGCAYFVLRLGIMTRNYVVDGGHGFNRSQARRAAGREARGLFIPLLGELVKATPSAMRSIWDFARKMGSSQAPTTGHDAGENSRHSASGPLPGTS